MVTVSGEEENEIPNPFPFPKHYTPDIELGLHMRNLQPKLLAKFYTRIANVMLIYKRYPSKKDYEQVGQQMVQKYPFLSLPVDPDSHVIKIISSLVTFTPQLVGKARHLGHVQKLTVTVQHVGSRPRNYCTLC